MDPALIRVFQPNWFLDVAETIDRKVAAFACYETEQRPHPHPRNELAIRATARHYGQTVGCEWAEPFVLVRALEP